MEFRPTEIPDVRLMAPDRHGDSRGFFSETWNRHAFAEAGIMADFVQDNHVLSGPAGTLRGLHFQVPPRAQTKLIRVTRGAIFDVAVDLRAGSASFGRHVRATLSAENWTQILIPAGFAHGYLTLLPDTEVIYKVSDTWSPAHEQGLRWNDPDLAIAWPIEGVEITVSERDTGLPGFAQWRAASGGVFP